MLRLIDTNDNVLNSKVNEEQEALLKCLRVLKQVLGLDARLGTYDANSNFFKLLCELSIGNEYIEVENKFFIPVMKSHKSFWGFIEIINGPKVITKARIKKAVNAINDILVSQIQPLSFIEDIDHINYDGKPFSIYVQTPDYLDGKKVAADIFAEYDFTNFLDLSEWLASKQKITLKDLKELRNTLLYVPETLELDQDQRSLLTLFSMLPKEMKGASLLMHSTADWTRTEQNLMSEREFLVHFKKRHYKINKEYKSAKLKH